MRLCCRRRTLQALADGLENARCWSSCEGRQGRWMSPVTHGLDLWQLHTHLDLVERPAGLFPALAADRCLWVPVQTCEAVVAVVCWTRTGWLCR